MTATAFLDLKQRAAKLSERERRQLSAYLIRLGQERSHWKQETARRLDEMAKGSPRLNTPELPLWLEGNRRRATLKRHKL